MATYQFRTWTGDGGTRIQRATVGPDGTLSNTKTFYPGQKGYKTALKLANKAGQGGTVNSSSGG